MCCRVYHMSSAAEYPDKRDADEDLATVVPTATSQFAQALAARLYDIRLVVPGRRLTFNIEPAPRRPPIPIAYLIPWLVLGKIMK